MAHDDQQQPATDGGGLSRRRFVGDAAKNVAAVAAGAQRLDAPCHAKQYGFEVAST